MFDDRSGTIRKNIMAVVKGFGAAMFDAIALGTLTRLDGFGSNEIRDELTAMLVEGSLVQHRFVIDGDASTRHGRWITLPQTTLRFEAMPMTADSQLDAEIDFMVTTAEQSGRR